MGQRIGGWRDLGSRPWFFPAAALCLGSALGETTSRSTAVFLVPGALGALAALLLGRRVGAHLLLLLSFACMGAGLAGLQARVEVPRGVQQGGQFHVEGRVESLETTADGLRATVQVARVEEAPAGPCRFRMDLSFHGAGGPLTPGERISALVTMKPLREASNWGEWDPSPIARRRGVRFHGGADLARVVRLTAPSRLWLRLERTRHGLAEAAKQVAPSPEAAALYATLAAGLRAELPDVWEERFSRSGLAHVLSVSGLHVAALAVVVLWLLRAGLVRVRRLSRRFDVRRVAAGVAVPALWSYVLFTGMQAPAVRSGLMLTVMLLAHVLWRQADALNSLALAACVLVVFDPASVLDLSLQLSFLAVLSLILLSPVLRAAIPWAAPEPGESSRVHRWVASFCDAILESLAASAAVTLASLPLVATAFHRISLAGLFANIVCLPLGGVLSALSAGGAAVYAVSPGLARPVLWVGTRACELLLRIAAFFSAQRWAAPELPTAGVAVTVLFFLGLALLALSPTRKRLGALLAAAAVATLFLRPRLRDPDAVTVTFLSVGHGDAIVLRSRGLTALVDGGGVPGGTDVGARVVIPYLRELGVSSIDLAVLSHPHPDHALGLIRALGAFPTRRLWLPAGNDDGPLTQALRVAVGAAPVEVIERGHAPFWLGDAKLDVLGPPRDRILLEGVNDRSTVLRVQHGEVSFLLTGDIEAAAEETLETSRVTVLKAPHHGSKTSSTAAFVERVHPRYVVFCVGRNNRFHFPNPGVVDRYRAVGSHCVRTDLDGAVRFVSDGHDVRLETFRPRPADAREEVDFDDVRAQLAADDLRRP